MSLIKAWANHFHSTIRMRGRSYQAQGRVSLLPVAPGQWVKAAVKGSGDQQHTVTISGAGPTAQVHCTCAFFAKGQYCKHIWATLLEVHYNGMKDKVEGESDDSTTADNTALNNQSDAPVLAMPKARKRDPGAVKPVAQEPEWVGRLTLLRSSIIETPSTTTALVHGLRQICYGINAGATRRLGQLVIELKQRQPTRTGWGPMRAWRVTPQAVSELTDGLDRELVSLIVGGQRIHSADHDPLDVGLAMGARGADTFAMVSGAWRTLLKRLAETGRAFVFDDEPEAGDADSITYPLRWGDDVSWVLWLVGQDTGEALALEVEFRKGGDRLAVHEPEVVLGGPDGLLIHGGVVGLLEDRDSYRWVQHYRDEFFAHGKGSPLKVAQGEVPRFLEKLYTLASLPELELPEGVGPQEEHATPVPHLELYSPGSGPGFEAGKDGGLTGGSGGTGGNGGTGGTGGGAMARNLLSARLWFGYGSHHIKPGQAGRFLPGGSANESGEVALWGQVDLANSLQDETQSTNNAKLDALDLAESVEDELAAQVRVQGGDFDDDDDDDFSMRVEAQGPAEDESDRGERVSFAQGKRPVIIRRDLRAEEQAVALFISLGFRPELVNGNSTDLLGSLPVKSMPMVVMQLLMRGWVVSADRKIMARPGAANLSVTSGMDWFELRGGMTFTRADGNDEVVPLPAILQAAKEGRTLITLGDGSQGLLPDQWLVEHGLLVGVAQVEGDVLKFKRSQAALLDTLLARQEMVQVDDAFAAARERLHHFDGIVPMEPPGDFKGSLRPYQKDGLGWLAFLREFGMGGVLADDMGLGKTIQVLAMLLAESGPVAQWPSGQVKEEKSGQVVEWPSGQVTEGERGSVAGYPNPRGDAARPRLGSTNSKFDGLDCGSSHKIRNSKSTIRPSLVVAPRSVVFNWIDEAQRFVPDLRVQAYTGTERQSLREAFVEHDLVITTYGLVRRDVDELRKQRFAYVILDEAQAIKNPGSQVAKAVRLLQADHRLALTGTPVENHLGDLWSIFEYLNPGMLGGAGHFGRLLKNALQSGRKDRSNGHDESNTPVETAVKVIAPTGTVAAVNGEGDSSDDAHESVQITGGKMLQSTDVARQLGQALRPFILRRTKKQVLRDLPPKTEQTVLCEMEGEQKELYEQLLKHYRGSLLSQSHGHESTGLGKNSVMVLEALLRLRQAACHPGLIDPKFANQPFAKLEALLERLDDIVEEGHKALVFSQFTSFLELVRKQLDARGMVYEYLDGQTRHRKQHVERFQTDPKCPVFLISLKAGGLGLNLTAAEYVFILDPWWNPAVENQAIDRAHRIGQQHHVFAYRLICQNTVEQRIAELQAKKRHLADAIIGQQTESLLGSLTRDNLERLLS